MPWREPCHEVMAAHVRELNSAIRTIKSGRTGEGVVELQRLVTKMRKDAVAYERQAPALARKSREELKKWQESMKEAS